MKTRVAAPRKPEDEMQHRDWMRNAAARCYVGLGLPAITRPLRERYSLSVTPSGRWPRVSWRRRTESSARILYSHRVNDDYNPCLSAIPTKVFEAQMRFVSRNYKVVSLDQMMDHLEAGEPETVVAVTFDDGYEDNYLNAFPILERYHVPATIFLTTGSMDTAEALWFEQLASALEHTSCAEIDAELASGGKLPLRTLTDRLGANSLITGILRTLPDMERRARLARILERLAVPAAASDIGKMLRWDQVRYMKARNIDFGGHTVTHPFLSKMPAEQVLWEISACKRRIEEETQSPVEFFAYPNGRAEDFSEDSKTALRAAGYRAAVTTNWGMNYRSTNPLELRRGQPWEEDPAVFAYKLDWYQMVND